MKKDKIEECFLAKKISGLFLNQFHVFKPHAVRLLIWWLFRHSGVKPDKFCCTNFLENIFSLVMIYTRWIAEFGGGFLMNHNSLNTSSGAAPPQYLDQNRGFRK